MDFGVSNLGCHCRVQYKRTFQGGALNAKGFNQDSFECAAKLFYHSRYSNSFERKHFRERTAIPSITFICAIGQYRLQHPLCILDDVCMICIYIIYIYYI